MINSLYNKFRYWSIGGSIWLLGDTHFEDKDCKLMDSNWITPEEQIKIINKYVHKNDTFIHLGDVGNPTWMLEIKARNKILIKGNHDEPKVKFEYFFDEIYDGPLYISKKILLSHEPIPNDWSLNIHGHDHSNWCQGKNHINLAANVCNYTPVSLSKIIKNGGISKINNIHRITIDNAIERNNKNECY